MLPDEIRTRRLRLRPFSLADAAEVFGYASDPEWQTYLPVPKPYALRDAERFVATSVLADRDERPNWALTLGARVVGGINFRFFSGHRIAEFGYSLSRDLWGRGYTTEATKALIDEAFSHYCQLMRIRAHADARNRGSTRVMEKAGMRLEGVLRSNRYIHEQFVDDACYGILRSEWSEGRA